MKLLVAALLLATACGQSPPSRFFVLTADPAPRSARSGVRVMVALGRVTVPSALDRPQMARRRGNEIVYSEEDRWAGPLEDMLRRALTDDLAARLPPGHVLIEESSRSPAAVTIAVDVARFDADENGQVTLSARWEMLGRDPGPGAVREATIVEASAGKSAAEVVSAMSRAVSALALRIAGGLR